MNQKIEFSTGALDVLYMQSEKKQNAILTAILKAASSDLTTLSRHLLQPLNGSETYVLSVDIKLHVVLKYIENKIRIADILSTDQINSFNKSMQTA